MAVPGVADRVRETTSTTGTGDITLAGAATGFRTFSSQFDVGAEIYYCIQGQTPGEWEVGTGYLSGSTTLVRFQVFSSSNSNALVSFSAGTKDVFCTMPAEQMQNKGVMWALRANLASY